MKLPLPYQTVLSSVWAVVFAAAVTVQCDDGTASTPRAQQQPGSEATLGVVVFGTPSGEIRVQVEVADEPDELQRGLMFRRELAADHGMLFIFPTEAVHSFWMRNTYLPLDMIFVGANNSVVGVVADAEPLTETSRAVDAPSRFVVEVNAGLAAQRGIGAGTKVYFERIAALAAGR